MFKEGEEMKLVFIGKADKVFADIRTLALIAPNVLVKDVGK
jgi:hypothetical protein